MKSYTPAIILLSLSNTVAFAPHLQTVLRSHHHDAHQAHPPHKNQYLEQLATSSQDMKSDTLSYSQASSTNNPTINAAATTLENEEKESLLLKIKQAGLAGAISYALWELGFWGMSIPVCLVGYERLTGHWPDLTNQEDLQKVGAEAFAIVNFARLAVPLRIGLALSTAGWIDDNLVKRFRKDE